MQRQKKGMYGSVRRGSVVKQAFRGSVRAWDSQKLNIFGNQRPAPAPAGATATKKSNVPIHVDSEDSDVGMDSFELESPPDSPMQDSFSISKSSNARAEVSGKLVSRRFSTRQSLSSEAPNASPRKALAPKSNNALNRKPIPSTKESISKSPIKSKPSRKSDTSRKSIYNAIPISTKPAKESPPTNPVRRGRGRPSLESKRRSSGNSLPSPPESNPGSPTVSLRAEEPRDVSLRRSGRLSSYNSDNGGRDSVQSAEETSSSDDNIESNGEEGDSDAVVEEKEESGLGVTRLSYCSPPLPSQRQTFYVEIISKRSSLEKSTAATVVVEDTEEAVAIPDTPMKDVDVVEVSAEVHVESAVEVTQETGTEHPAVRVADKYITEDVEVILSPQQKTELRRQMRRGRKRREDRTRLSGEVSALRLTSPSRTTPKPSIDTPPTTPGSSPSVEDYPQSAVREILKFCKESTPISYTAFFTSINPDLSHIRKIGQSSYGEVYVHRTPSGDPVVLKFLPVVSEITVAEITQEIRIAGALSPLPGFVKFHGAHVLTGACPAELDTSWRKWEAMYNLEYRRGDVALKGVEYHTVIALSDAGCSLDNCTWNSWAVPLEIFRQTLKTLAVGERERRFEHRDLHGGNVMVRDKSHKNVKEDNGAERECYLNGFADLEVTLIDYTLSRADIPEEYGGGDEAFVDLDPLTFEAEGLYQFDIYRMMRIALSQQTGIPMYDRPITEETELPYCNYANSFPWNTHIPATNVHWLHFILVILTGPDCLHPFRPNAKRHIRKPKVVKKNAFELGCYEMMKKLTGALEYKGENDVRGRICDGNLVNGWKGADEFEMWCLENEVFKVLEDERERLRVESQENEDKDEDEEDQAVEDPVIQVKKKKVVKKVEVEVSTRVLRKRK